MDHNQNRIWRLTFSVDHNQKAAVLPKHGNLKNVTGALNAENISLFTGQQSHKIVEAQKPRTAL